MLREGLIKLTLEDFKKPKGTTDWMNPYAVNIRVLMETSLRWKILVDLIKSLPCNRYGKAKKILIYSNYPVTAGIANEVSDFRLKIIAGL